MFKHVSRNVSQYMHVFGNVFGQCVQDRGALRVTGMCTDTCLVHAWVCMSLVHAWVCMSGTSLVHAWVCMSLVHASCPPRPA